MLILLVGPDPEPLGCVSEVFESLVWSNPYLINVSSNLVTRDQPYLFATIFKHYIYVCFHLLILMYGNQLKLH